ncbi:unnamed protein product [Symbiodinium sp. CCMP2592]|nr:unnamed protein product [Symbiodinium sp. CCMP2592]
MLPGFWLRLYADYLLLWHGSRRCMFVKYRAFQGCPEIGICGFTSSGVSTLHKVSGSLMQPDLTSKSRAVYPHLELPDTASEVTGLSQNAPYDLQIVERCTNSAADSPAAMPEEVLWTLPGYWDIHVGPHSSSTYVVTDTQEDHAGCEVIKANGRLRRVWL